MKRPIQTLLATVLLVPVGIVQPHKPTQTIGCCIDLIAKSIQIVPQPQFPGDKWAQNYQQTVVIPAAIADCEAQGGTFSNGSCVLPPPPPPPVVQPLNESEAWYKAWIYNEESGNNPAKWNTSGCLGLGQACPASKLLIDCPNEDYACEDNWFTNYMLSNYGSWQNAYYFHIRNNWW